jgi:hypothetical protein
MPKMNNRTRTQRENSALNYKRDKLIMYEANNVRWMERAIDMRLPIGLVERARAHRTMAHFQKRLDMARAAPIL